MINNDFPAIITRKNLKRNHSAKSQITTKQKAMSAIVEYQLGRANSNVIIVLK